MPTARGLWRRLKHWGLSLAPPPPLPAWPPLALPRSLTVIAPHPDDEWAAAGALMAAVAAAGGQVSVVLLTDGGAYRAAARAMGVGADQLGAVRVEESRRFLAELGAPAEALTVLGLADRSLAECWERPSTADAVVARLSDHLRAAAPQAVVFPHPADDHPDHWAAGLFALAALMTACPPLPLPRMWAYLVHAGEWPRPLGFRPRHPLLPPAALAGEAWRAWPLSSAATWAKGAALKHYRSQMALAAERFYLRSFARANELFAEGWEEPGERRYRPPASTIRVWHSPVQAGVGLHWQPAADGRLARLWLFWRPTSN